MVALRQCHRYLHGEVAVVIGSGLTAEHFFVVVASADGTAVPIAPIGPPPEGHAAHHLIFYAGSLHRHAGIAAGRSPDYHGVACLVVLFYLRKLHLEGGALVFLHADGVRLPVGLDGEGACQAVGGQGEVGCTHTVCIGHAFLPGHLLPIGIAQGEGHLLAFRGLVLPAFGDVVDHHGGVDCLSRAVDGAVGEDAGLLHLFLCLVVAVLAGYAEFRTGLVAVGIGEHLATVVLLTLIEVLALGIGGDLSGFVFPVGCVLPDAQVGIGDGLACGGTDHHVARPAIGLWLCHRVDIGDEVELAYHFCGGGRREFQHVDPHGQAFQLEGVFKQFVGLLAHEAPFVLDRQWAEQRLELLVVLSGIDADVAIGVHAVDV